MRCRHGSHCNGGLREIADFSGDGKNSAPESLAERRENLFSHGDEVSPEKSDTAGRFTDLGTDL
jgi:hypothetical protein